MEETAASLDAAPGRPVARRASSRALRARLAPVRRRVVSLPRAPDRSRPSPCRLTATSSTARPGPWPRACVEAERAVTRVAQAGHGSGRAARHVAVISEVTPRPPGRLCAVSAKGVPRLPRRGSPPWIPPSGRPLQQRNPQRGEPLPPRAFIGASLRAAGAWGPWGRIARTTGPGPPFAHAEATDRALGSRPLQGRVECCGARPPPSRGAPRTDSTCASAKVRSAPRRPSLGQGKIHLEETSVAHPIDGLDGLVCLTHLLPGSTQRRVRREFIESLDLGEHAQSD